MVDAMVDAVVDAMVAAGPAIDRPRDRAGTGLLRYAAVKAGGALVSIALLAVLGFFLFRVLPGDPAVSMTRDRPVSAAELDQLRAQLGVDKPLPAQFADYLARLAHGDLGTSYQYRQPVSALIAARLGPTLLLTGTATLLAVGLGLWLGARAAWRRGSGSDRALTATALVFWSMPTFWLGLMLLMVFGTGVGPIPGLFPSGGMSSPGASGGFLPHVLDVAHHLALPCLTLVAVLYAQYLMVMRASLIEEMDAAYLTTARATGLREALVRRRHAVPNALLPSVTLIFLNLGFTVSGAVTVETVFSWPGLGSLTYVALSVPDLPLLQGSFLALAASLVVMNLAADLLHWALDPRVRAP
jgi:peptide/nickel transport system permease protein